MAKYAAALDQGTTSSRAMVFDHGGRVVSVVQKEHEQIYPKPGWVEHDAKEIWARSQEVLDEALCAAGDGADGIAGRGVTKRGEDSVVLDGSAAPVARPLATYAPGPKVRWILDNVHGPREKAAAGDLIFGNMDTWLIWNLTGGTNGGLHITDVTNPSRTMLMDLKTLSLDKEIALIIGVPFSMLPEIHGSS